MHNAVRRALVTGTVLTSIVALVAPAAAAVPASGGDVVAADCTVAGAPGAVAATPGANAVTVSWTAAADNGTPITGYVVRATRSGAPAGSVAADATATTATVSGLAGGAPHDLTVQAVSACGLGDPGTPAGGSLTPTGPSTTYASTVLGENPAAYYRFGETGGTTAADSSASNAYGPLGPNLALGGAGAVATDADTGLRSVNGNCCPVTARPNLPQYNEARTVEGWVKPNDDYFRYLAGWGQSGNEMAFAVGIDPNQIGVVTYNDDRYFPLPSTTKLRDGYWHHVAVTYDGTIVRAYLDGVELGSGQYFDNPLDTIDNGGLYVGAAYEGRGNPIYGSLDEVAIYPAALSAAEIADHLTTAGYSRPTAPRAVSAIAGDDNEVQVTWGVARATRAPITGYLVTAVAGTRVGPSTVTLPGASAIRLRGLAGGTAYRIEISAINAYGAGPVARSAVVTPTGTSTYSAAVLDDHPLAYYRFGESPGTTYAANSASRDGTSAYGTVQTLGQPGAVVAGSDTSVTANGACCVTHTRLSLPLYDASRTVEAWVKPSDASYRYVAGWGRSGNEQAFAVGVDPGQIGVTTYNDDRSFPINGLTDLRDGAWHHVVVTYDGTSVRAYLDGVPLGAPQTFDNPLDTIDETGLWIGAAYEARGYPIYGGLDEVAVYGTALPASAVAAHFAAAGYARPDAPTGLTATAGVNRATVRWSAPVAGATPITRYLVSSSSGQSMAVPGSATSATLTGLAGGVATTLTVSAGNAYGDSAAASAPAVTPTGTATTYASNVVADSPVAYYRLGETGVSLAADSSGHDDVGRLGNVSTPGLAGALATDPDTAQDANGSCCLVNARPALAYGNVARSVEGWIMPRDNTYRYLAGWGRSGDDQTFAVGVDPSHIGVTAYNDDRSFTLPAAINVRDGSWHHVVVTYDGTTLRAYLDGLTLGSRTFARPLNTVDNGGLYVGAAYEGRGYQIYGGVDEVAVYARALTAAQVAAHFAAAGYSRPSAVGSVTVTAQSNAARVDWTAATSSGTPVTRYLVTALVDGVPRNSVAVVGTARTARLTGLAGGIAHTFSVVASNAYGDGPAATSAAATPSGAASTYATTVLGNSPAAYYRFSETAGSTAADSSGRAAATTYGPGLTLGGAGAVANDADPGLTANGSCCPLATSAAPLPLYNGARTVEAWVKPSDNTTRYLAGWGRRETDGAFGVTIDPSNIGVIGWSDDRYFPLPVTARLRDGAWHQVVVTYDGTTATAYLDGQSIGTRTFARRLNTRTNPLYVGAGPEGQGYQIYGGLDEVSVYSSALSSGDVAAHFAAAGWARPAQVRTPSATGGANSATVTWTAGTAGAAPVNRYVVTAIRGGQPGLSVEVPGTTTTATLHGLGGGSGYAFDITPYNSYGAGPPKRTTNVTVTGGATYSDAVLAALPSAYYRFSETAGTNLADSSGNGGEAAVTGTVTLGSAGITTGDAALTLPSSCCTAPAAASSPPVPIGGSARTVEGWVKPGDATFRYLAGWGTTGTDQEFSVGVDPTRVGLITYADDLYFPITGVDIRDGNWHQVVIVYDGARTVTAYLDGAQLGPSQLLAHRLNTRPGQLFLGAGGQGRTYPMFGGLDEVSIYPAALDAATVSTHYTKGSAGA